MLGFLLGSVAAKAKEPEPDASFLDASVCDAFGAPSWLAQMSTGEFLMFVGFTILLAGVHFYGKSTPMKKQATVNMRALNRVNVFKEVFLGYVGAGMLEPIMAIASSEYDVTTKSLVVNLAQLLGLFSWLYLLSDAFDMMDVQGSFVYWDRISQQGSNKDLPAWIKKAKDTGKDKDDELRGSLFRDLALWFNLAAVGAAYVGVVGHRDVIHSHAIVILWVLLHHQARAATAWRGTGYFHTLFAPSTALLPLEWCLNLLDQEMIGDVGDVESWRTFIKAEAGVEISIEF